MPRLTPNILSFRLGLFGFGASDLLREDNNAAGEDGVGNYGMLRHFYFLHFTFFHFGLPLPLILVLEESY